jgi:hypothetical protein
MRPRTNTLLQTGSFSAESQNSLIGRATTKAIENLVRRISELSGKLSEDIAGNKAAELAAVMGHITGVVGAAIVVDLGSSQGLHKGGRLKVLAERRDQEPERRGYFSRGGGDRNSGGHRIGRERQGRKSPNPFAQWSRRPRAA